ncbi:MAG TPA: hypothetical protein VLT90_17120 [Terriglobales bacterium]|nr:hypothetical protein [Terriglobales bacterium]
MGRAKARTKKSAPAPDPKAKSKEEIQKVQNQVANVILDSSVEMAARVVQSVTESGQITALKFLWDAVGLFSGRNHADDEDPDTLAKILLERMGLEDESPGEGGNRNGDVESKD